MPHVQDFERKHLIAFPGGAKGQTPHDVPTDTNIHHISKIQIIFLS